MKYSKDIIKILTEAGDNGLSLKKISRHIFNVHNTFFESVNIEDVHSDVKAYLLRNSKNKDSVIQSVAGKRGYYKLNMSSVETQQLMLQFRDEEEGRTQQEEQSRDESLSLFDY